MLLLYIKNPASPFGKRDVCFFNLSILEFFHTILHAVPLHFIAKVKVIKVSIRLYTVQHILL